MWEAFPLLLQVFGAVMNIPKGFRTRMRQSICGEPSCSLWLIITAQISQRTLPTVKMFLRRPSAGTAACWQSDPAPIPPTAGTALIIHLDTATADQTTVSTGSRQIHRRLHQLLRLHQPHRLPRRQRLRCPLRHRLW